MNAKWPLGLPRARAYKIPTDFPEAYGTIAWDSTTIVIVEIEALGHRGIGYTYSSASIAALINDMIAKQIEGRDAMDPLGYRAPRPLYERWARGTYSVRKMIPITSREPLGWETIREPAW